MTNTFCPHTGGLFKPPALPVVMTFWNLQEHKLPEERCGHVGLIGRPNVGKSTLLNRIVGQKISITTHRPQTTRNRILGIKTIDACQIIFIDTPGIHLSEKLLNQRIVKYAVRTLEESDLNLLLVEPVPLAVNTIHREDARILQLLDNKLSQTLLLINKIDTVSREVVLRTISIFNQHGPFAEIVPISALKLTNVEHLVAMLPAYIPENAFYFEADQITDISERFLMGELVREALFRVLQKELPYSAAVHVESFEETSELIRVHCKIYVERESQKGIVIGRKGGMLKQIGKSARQNMEYLLGNKVYLSLQVRVLKKWSTNARYLDRLSLE